MAGQVPWTKMVCPLSPPPSSSPVKSTNQEFRRLPKKAPSKAKGRSKVSFWRLKTLASEDFDVSRLTERQQIAFFSAQAQCSDNMLQASPFRLDRLLAEKKKGTTENKLQKEFLNNSDELYAKPLDSCLTEEEDTMDVTISSPSVEQVEPTNCFTVDHREKQYGYLVTEIASFLRAYDAISDHRIRIQNLKQPSNARTENNSNTGI